MTRRGVNTFFALLLGICGAISAQEFRLATFSMDVTPPLGHALMGGGIAPAHTVADPLYFRGVVLMGPEAPVVFAAIDWCEIRNDAYTRWRETLADAAGTTPERILFASVHQHDAPIADLEAQRLLDEAGLPGALCNAAFVLDCIERTAAAVRESIEVARVVTHYGTGQGEVRELASNRRVERDDGQVSYPRMSATADAAVRAAPVGEVDPWLKTLSFWRVETPVAALHVYAVHPMSFYGRGSVSADFVGIARALRQAEDPGVHQVYFSGCSGDVVAGKWNDGSPENRLVLAAKLHAAMTAAWEATERHPLEQMTVRTALARLPVREDDGYSEAALQATLMDPDQRVFERIMAAMGLSWRAHAAKPVMVPALDLGQAQFLLLPAESFVGYQLYAQEQRPDSFVLTAGYGECAPGYIPTPRAIGEDFIAQHGWCWVAPSAPGPLFAAIREALGE